jgi:hypothetical protein
MRLFAKGEAVVGLGDDVKDAGAGTFVCMPPGLRHSIKAKTPWSCCSCCSSQGARDL